MDNILSFFSENGNIVSSVLMFFTFLVLLFKNGDTKSLKEIFNMVYRTEQNYSTKSVAGQTFSNMKKVYRLNKATNELEDTGELIDITEIANSCKDVCMQSVLERFFPSVDTVNAEQQAIDIMQEDLDIMQETIDLANQYRTKFNLSNELSVTQVFDFVKDQSNKLKEDLLKKEQENNAQEIIEKSV